MATLSTIPGVYEFDDLPAHIREAVDARIAKYDLPNWGAANYRQFRADRLAWREWAWSEKPHLVEARRAYLEGRGSGIGMMMIDHVMGRSGQLELLGGAA